MIRPGVALLNKSTVLTDDEVNAISVALQEQVLHHFGPAWGRTADLHVGDATKRSDWRLIFADDSDQANALGYHDMTPHARPQGFVFAKTDKDYGYSVSVTASHELLEMLADPQINLTALDYNTGRLYAYESADAVEADDLGYEIGGVLVSNFVLPAYFDPEAANTDQPVDYRRVLDEPFTLAPGGYMSYLDLNAVDRGWQQVTDRHRPRGAGRDEQRKRATAGKLRRSTQ